MNNMQKTQINCDNFIVYVDETEQIVRVIDPLNLNLNLVSKVKPGEDFMPKERMSMLMAIAYGNEEHKNELLKQIRNSAIKEAKLTFNEVETFVSISGAPILPIGIDTLTNTKQEKDKYVTFKIEESNDEIFLWCTMRTVFKFGHIQQEFESKNYMHLKDKNDIRISQINYLISLCESDIYLQFANNTYIGL